MRDKYVVENNKIIIHDQHARNYRYRYEVSEHRRPKIYIIWLNETHLPPTKNLRLRNYHTYLNNFPGIRGFPAHGRTAILVHHRTIFHHEYLQT